MTAVARFVLAVPATAVLCIASQPPFGVAPLAALAFVPWLWAAGGASVAGALAGSVAVGLAVGCAVGAWIPDALGELGSSGLHGVLGMLATAGWVKVPVFLAIGGVFVLMRNSRGVAPAFAASVFAIEWLASSWRWGVPWALLGHSQVDVAGVAQLAVAGGVPAVSALLAGVNVEAWRAIATRQRRSAVRGLAGWLAAWGALAAAGLPVAQWARGAAPGSDEVALLAVQTNVPRGERWADGAQALNLQRTVTATERALRDENARPDAVLWPENVLTTPIDGPGGLAAEIGRAVDALGVPVIAGVARLPLGPEPRRYRSSVVWLEPGAGITDEIDKVRAVPVLESASQPWGTAWLARAFGRASDWEKVEEADSAGPLHGGFSVATVLCYEALFPRLVAERRDRDAVAIVNLADDGWAPGEMATRQLTAFARFRAVEQRLPLIRVAHGGLSTLVDEYGRTVRSLPLDAYAHMTVVVRAMPPPTVRERASVLALPLAAGVGVWWLAGRLLAAQGGTRDGA